MSLDLAAILALALILLLFGVAALVERKAEALRHTPRLRHLAYTLALGVYCSSWTFYGAVGSAVRDGWTYLPIYLGPILLLVAAPRFLRRLAHSVADEQAATVSDFIAARFGHDVVVARLVTVIALLGTVPYIALQFLSIGNAFAVVSGQQVGGSAMLAAACLLTVFSMLFAARRFELAGRSEGLLFAIGMESLIKIAALVLVGFLAVWLLLAEPWAVVRQGAAVLGERFAPGRLSLDVAVIFLISTMAIIVLPRQFYMGLAEAQSPDDLPRARLGLAAYLLAMALVVIPIALAGTTEIGSRESADVYVLLLPAESGHGGIVAIALLGGISAAAAMVIVDSSALATMVSNDLIFPTVLRGKRALEGGAIGRRMLLVRRLSIAGIIALALAWAMLVSARESLASIGLVAFAAMAQFTPHLILAVQGANRDPLAARASLATGLVVWLYTLGLPPILPTNLLDGLAAGPFNPLRLFGIGQASPLAHGVIWSLGANLLVYALVAARHSRPRPLPKILRTRRVTDLQDLVQLTASFVGQERADREFPAERAGKPVNRRWANRAQQLIAGVVGSSSARALVTSALAGGQMSLQDVTRLLDEGGQSLRFSRQLLAETFENIDAGISVVDAELNLVAWNSRYEELFDYPPGLVRVGVPVADLIRHNAQRGDFGPGDIEFHIEKRLNHLRRRLEHAFERRRKDGRVIKTVGGPMSGGGYVMSFTDITEEVRMRDELEHTLDELEQRVSERTRELSEANRRLAKADREKTRFLAAASHDLLQPLHAARLFTAALERETEGPGRKLVGHVEGAIGAAEDLLRALLDISKLDAGGVSPRPEPVALQAFITALAESFRPLAAEKALDLRVGPCPGVVETDPGLLRSVLQNLLTNALRYTPSGGILIGTRRRGEEWRIDVIDTGVGIAPDQFDAIFGEFTRLGEVEVEGLGLGLALVERISRVLGGRIDLASVPGKGSRFSLILPVHDGAGPLAGAPQARARQANARPLTVLVIDNDERIVAATSALLDRLGHRPLGGHTIADALARCAGADLMLVDYQLDDGEDGLTLIEAVRRRHPGKPALLITAESGAQMLERAAAMKVPVLAKPVDPAMLQRVMAELSVPEVEA
ncbi:PAS-domain containing protein [Novosphingobium sp. TH158]|uniref:hybrid sensor histidine kinase/response regulator n=1 Tax=Novosphingobium sp. TH158 TaxID=2067455 RepID=UPI000C7A1C42|nr:PAS-domain containing protein [Novosphingobium sp. TH158]PLK27507.1 hybrid sensor histidine kinase/response regulator [Novosphingobium sp. TH158]